ncbi:hypothetical protein ACFX2I_005401 [Malus domestica]|uniref:protein PYRICULARIA ORYZAE RESISTANCE 21-like isoform X2 n=1 Tax=Malus sylvestris TaxID=3752 RepID=UPI0010A9D88D|nr:protein PYRICULARIA ORYZAE RESISTANCE 21-like [Malus domestica]XP_050108350.1 protein PYRICULARIA ORYZAE RESISTANCE 21-like isoform X2 [Malus sylvestris]XP_050108351.1 protein PYRICULARIA ORYZAE RESISTANCE 21-like isoform X3 [Malus sylvestris]
MGEKEKVTIMVLKVDLQCHKCYKKVKKVLRKFPQIQDQIYDEKQNQVVIKVVCCSPEKIRDKICYKGGSVIKSIEIKEPEKPKPQLADKPKGIEKPKEADKSKPADTPKEVQKSIPQMELVKHSPLYMQPVPYVPGYPPPVQACCMDCYQGRACGSWHSGYGGGPSPYIQYDGYYGRPVYDSYGSGNRGYYEENPSACTIM